MTKAILRGAVLAGLGLALRSQPSIPLQAARSEHLPPHLGSLLVADIDADGFDDLIATSRAQQYVLLNRADDRFVDVTAQALPLAAPRIAMSFDVDRDGDVDLLGRGPTVLRNNGRGVFALDPLPITSHIPLSSGDLDGDGSTDVLALDSVSPGTLVTLHNDGTGHFSATASVTVLSFPWSATDLADLDGDGDLDLVLASSGQAAFLLNDGSGQFGRPTSLPAPAALPVDIDGDGDIDLISSSYVLVNNGAGQFTEESAARYPRRVFSALVHVDVDGDGDQDLILALGEVWLNDGRGVFAAAPVPDLQRNSLTTLAVARLDADSLPDLVALPGHLFAGRGAGRFAGINPAPLDELATVVQVGDLTGDGDPDLLERTNGGPLAYRTLRNDGRAFFEPMASVQVWPSLPFTHVEALGDLDGDGDLDMLGSFGGPTRGLMMLPNRGNGTFGAPRPAPFTSSGLVVDLYLDDLDGDRDLDAVDVGSEGVVLAHNDGTGGFPAGVRGWAGAISASDYADFDGDGDRDLLVADQQLTLLENRQGTFVDVTSQYFAAAPTGYGRPVLATRSGSTWLIWLRNGAADAYERAGGSFVLRPAAGIALPGAVTGARRVSVDAAGTYVAVRGASTASILLLTASGLRDVSNQVLPGPFRFVVGDADLDLDGDSDLVAVDAYTSPEVLLGQRRALRCRFNPVVGGSVDLALRDGAAAVGHPVSCVGLLGAVSRLPLPGLGVLRIDPRIAGSLPVVGLFSTNEVGVSIPVPNVRALKDVEFGVQFAHVDSTAAIGPLARFVVR
ncbi:MAG: VCBS repeat-containing protein [Planctomycetota bacterium]